jgi:hypothetical protein
MVTEESISVVEDPDISAFKTCQSRGCLARPRDYTATVIIWHAAPLGLMTGALAWTGSALLRSRDWTHAGSATT